MKAYFDIGHPAHVHYFKYVIRNLIDKGHEIFVTARDKDVTLRLLEFYKIPFKPRGKGAVSIAGKLLYMARADWLIFNWLKNVKPDILVSFSSPYAAHVSWLLKKPHITLNDTEHTDKYHKKFTYPFTDSIITPYCYYNNLGPKQLRINSIIENFYLNSKYYRPKPELYNKIGLDRKTKYVILRFVSWKAHHDYGEHGISAENKIRIIKLLQEKYRVFISSESVLPDDFKKYKLNIRPEWIHDALAFAEVFIGESGTMASESALLGTPVIYTNSLPLMGYLKEERNAGLLKYYPTNKGLIDEVKTYIEKPDLKFNAKQIRDRLVRNYINPVDFLTWLIENYPESVKKMRENPDYQLRFR